MVPVTVNRKQAGAFVGEHHRRHDPDQGDRFCLGAWKGHLVGVAVVGRPRGKGIDQERIVEVTRLCTDGTKNACSFLYALSATVAWARGFFAIITYTAQDEGGASLRALGWWGEALEPRTDDWPSGAESVKRKIRWLKLLGDFEAIAPELADEQSPTLDMFQGRA